MKLKLKNDYVGTIVRRNKIVFDADKVNEDKYPYFYDNGFSDLFETETQPPIEYKGVEQPKKKRSRKKKNEENN